VTGELRKLRRARGLGLREAAIRAGINHGYLSQLERGKIATPSPKVLHKLAAAYDEPPALLLHWAGYVTDDPLTPNQARLLHIAGDPSTAELRAIEAVVVAIREARIAQDANTWKATIGESSEMEGAGL
jgi:transcriptional regulator with XRE-family HTH domain